MSWELYGAIAVGLFVAVFGAALGLLNPSERTPSVLRRFRHLAWALAIALIVEFGFRVSEGEPIWTSFVCSSNPQAAQHAEQCDDVDVIP